MRNLVLILFGFIGSSSRAEVVSFEVLWSKIMDASPAISQAEHQVKAVGWSKMRSRLQFLPSLGVSGRFVSTNDPGAVFYSNLGQRQIQSSDFNPYLLNQPARTQFSQVSLGLDLPLFEGGMRVAELGAQSRMESAMIAQKDEVMSREYILSAREYGSLNILSASIERVQELRSRVDSILSRYSIGSGSNPVGYSGMLGLKVLRNRIQALGSDLSSEKSRVVQSLSERSQLPVGTWSPQNIPTAQFIDRELKVSSDDVRSETHQEKSARFRSEAYDRMKDAERARYLPKIGIFAEEGLVAGNRDTGTAFSAGAYLQWALFDPKNVGKKAEAEEQHLSAVSDLDRVRLESGINRIALIEKENVMNESLKLLLDSDQLMLEQSKTASRLFQSGTISALQLAEVLNRRLDLILSLKELEIGLIEVRGQRLMLSGRTVTKE